MYSIEDEASELYTRDSYIIDCQNELTNTLVDLLSINYYYVILYFILEKAINISDDGGSQKI